MPDLGDVLGWGGFKLGYISVIIFGAIIGLVGNWAARKIEESAYLSRQWVGGLMIVGFTFLLFCFYLYAVGIPIYHQVSFLWWLGISFLVIVVFAFLSLFVLDFEEIDFISNRHNYLYILLLVIAYSVLAAIVVLAIRRKVPIYEENAYFHFMLTIFPVFLVSMYLPNLFRRTFREKESLLLP